MKTFLLLAGCLVTATSFSQYRKDSTDIVNLLKADYTTLGQYDSAAHVKNVTYDFVLVEEGEVWDLQRELQYFREHAGKKQTRNDQFRIYSVKISGSTAYAVYDLQSEIRSGEKSRAYHWLETAVFRKVGNQWKIALIHSSQVANSQ